MKAQKILEGKLLEHQRQQLRDVTQKPFFIDQCLAVPAQISTWDELDLVMEDEKPNEHDRQEITTKACSMCGSSRPPLLISET